VSDTQQDPRPVSQPSTVTVQLPWSWFQYSEHGGPPVGSTLGVAGQQGTVTGFRRQGEDMLSIDLELPELPSALVGLPGSYSMDGGQ